MYTFMSSMYVCIHAYVYTNKPITYYVIICMCLYNNAFQIMYHTRIFHVILSAFIQPKSPLQLTVMLMMISYQRNIIYWCCCCHWRSYSFFFLCAITWTLNLPPLLLKFWKLYIYLCIMITLIDTFLSCFSVFII